MNQIVILPPIALPACLADAEIAAALSYAEQEKSEGTPGAPTDRTSGSSPSGASRCRRQPARWPGSCPSQADGGLKASTIGRRGAAIGYAHRLAGHEAPGNSEACKAVVRGIRRTIGCAPARKSPATADVIGQMLKHCPVELNCGVLQVS
jgi:hypothetical protein